MKMTAIYETNNSRCLGTNANYLDMICQIR